MNMYENMKTGDYNDISSEPKKSTRESLMRYMSKSKQRSNIRHKKITDENIARAMNVLIDSGIEKDDAGVILQAIGYTLFDEEIFTDNIDMNKVNKRLVELRSIEV